MGISLKISDSRLLWNQLGINAVFIFFQVVEISITVVTKLSFFFNQRSEFWMI